MIYGAGPLCPNVLVAYLSFVVIHEYAVVSDGHFNDIIIDLNY